MNRKPVIIFTAILVALALSASSCDEPTKDTAQGTGQALTEDTFKQQQAAIPYPAAQLRDSLERANLRDRLLTLNKPSKIGYVYLMNFGQIVGYYAIRGKVSNTDSQLTTTDLIVEDRGERNGGNVTVPAPGDDGSYGPNESGNFFFTTEGVLVETDLNYLYADAPLPVNAPKLNGAAPTK